LIFSIDFFAYTLKNKKLKTESPVLLEASKNLATKKTGLSKMLLKLQLLKIQKAYLRFQKLAKIWKSFLKIVIAF
jgi:hypothetical protein